MPSQHARIDTMKITLGTHEMTYLAAGPTDGPLVIFVHGWPELGHSWRHQLPVLAGLGFRAIAPDLRGHGGSTVYDRHEDYTMEKHVGDLLALIDSLGREQAVWVGHDWGAPVVWSLASHHPDRCYAIANLCVPYRVLDNGLDGALALVDRSVYPKERYPAGQWEYQLFYQENFARAKSVFEANPTNTITALFRKWSPDDRGKPAITANVRNDNGWLGGVDVFPELERDDDVISADDLEAYVSALTATGFFGSCSFYMNHSINAEYAKSAHNNGTIDMPVLFLTGAYDYVCECVDSRLPEPMREYCRNLTERTVNSGHWMAQEKPVDVNNALTRWLASSVVDAWPEPPL
ncbi:MAG: pimeloyl-ACP methyl ester carboxylesterase [Gammaproteobacteria bacterium]|jgi:pimeloyl-ACP methyl ester carboxylesterase